jgi:hypothetical protein
MLKPTPAPWEQPGWFDRVNAWVQGELRRLGLPQRGDLELVRTRPWAAVARASTDSGDVWFKQPAPSLAFEPGATIAVSSRDPGFTPRVLASEGTWMLIADAGVQLREHYRRGGKAPMWDQLLPRYAELQIALAGAVDEFLALGVPDRRPAAVAEAYPATVARVIGKDVSRLERCRRLAVDVQALADELADALPITLIHEEATEANIFVRAGRARLLDWAEASISHPFAGAVNTLRDIAYRRRLRANGRELLRLRSAYLEPWTRFAPMTQLTAQFSRGYLLGVLCRVMSWDRFLADQPSEVRAEYGRNAAVWLDIFCEGMEDGVRIGGQ